MHEFGSDRWIGHIEVDACGRWEFAVEAWVDRFASWRWEVRRKVEGGQSDLTERARRGRAALRRRVALGEGGARGRARGSPRGHVAAEAARARRRPRAGPLRLLVRALSPLLGRVRGRREGAAGAGRELGFDVVYLPPIHPIGETNRKGRNNVLKAAKGDPGSPWAIGSDGGRPRRRPPRARDDRRLRPAGRRRAASSAWRSASTSRSSARPTTPGCRSTRSGSTAAPTGRSSTPRTRPSTTRTSTTSTSTPRTGRGSGRRCSRRRRLLGRPRRQGLPRRQPAHQAGAVLGVADRRRSTRATRRSSSSPRPSRAR